MPKLSRRYTELDSRADEVQAVDTSFEILEDLLLPVRDLRETDIVLGCVCESDLEVQALGTNARKLRRFANIFILLGSR